MSLSPLQQAAQAVIDNCYEYKPRELHALHLALRKALDAELQQSVEPVLWITDLDDPIICKTEFETATFCEDDQRPIPVYLHPPQQAVVTSGERAEVVARLRCLGRLVSYSDVYTKAADMLEADAQQAEPYGWMVSGVPTVMRGSLAQEIQEQEAKRIGGDCKAFPVYTKPQQAKRVPMTTDDLYAAYIAAADQMLRAQDERLVFAFARAIEAHHGIGGQP